MISNLKQAARSAPVARHMALALRYLPLPERAWRHLSFLGPFNVQLPDNRSFQMIHHGHRVENEIFWAGIFGRWEKTSLRLWYEQSKSAEFIIDVGANSGVYSLLAAAANPSARILAVEPLPAALWQLEKNISVNETNIGVFKGVFSNTSGSASLHMASSAFQYSASLEPDFSAELSREIRVPSTTLDNLVRQGKFPAPNLIKIDVEGHEVAVLEGMVECLDATRPDLLIEVLGDEQLVEILNITEPFGYRHQWVDENEGLCSERPQDLHSRNVWFECRPNWQTGD